MASNQFLQSYAAAKTPKTNGVMQSLLPKPATNMTAAPKPQTVPTGPMSVAPKPANTSPSIGGQNSFLNNYSTSNSFLNNYMGAQAKAPEQNVKPVATTIAPAQVKTVPTAPSTTSKPPEQPTTPPPAQTSFSGGAVLPTAPAGTPAPQQGNGQPSPYTANSGLYGQLIAGMANASTQPGQQYQQAYGDYNKSVDELKQFNTQLATAQGNIAQQPIPLEFQQGRAQVLANQAAQQQNALQGAVSAKANVLGAANTQQGLLQSLLQSATGAAGQALTPGQYQPFGDTTGAGSSFQNGLQRLSQYSQAQQNISQGQSYQGQSADLSTTMSQLDTLTPTLQKFMDTSGINSQGSPFYNQAIKNYMAQVGDPAAVATLNGYMGELRQYTGQILLASGLTPTDVQATMGSFDPANLSPSQLNAFLINLKNMGNIRLQPLQQAQQNSYNAVGQGAYVGAPATPTVDSAVSYDRTPITNNPVQQGLIGGVIGGWQTLMDMASGAAHMLFK